MDEKPSENRTDDTHWYLYYSGLFLQAAQDVFSLAGWQWRLFPFAIITAIATFSIDRYRRGDAAMKEELSVQTSVWIALGVSAAIVLLGALVVAPYRRFLKSERDRLKDEENAQKAIKSLDVIIESLRDELDKATETPRLKVSFKPGSDCKCVSQNHWESFVRVTNPESASGTVSHQTTVQVSRITPICRRKKRSPAFEYHCDKVESQTLMPVNPASPGKPSYTLGSGETIIYRVAEKDAQSDCVRFCISGLQAPHENEIILTRDISWLIYLSVTGSGPLPSIPAHFVVATNRGGELVFRQVDEPTRAKLDPGHSPDGESD